MKKNSRLFKLLRALAFFCIGAVLFWFVYDDIELKQIKNEIYNINFLWIYISLAINLFSQYIRALRWKMLIVPMGYKPRTYNLFFAILILGFMNIVVPRGGEVASAAVINKHEKIPFVKLMGTVTLERITDLLVLLLLFGMILLWQFPTFSRFLQSPDITLEFSSITQKVFVIAGVLIGIGLLVIVLHRLGVFKKLNDRIKKVKADFVEGIGTIMHMKNRKAFIFYSFLIYLLWFSMSFVTFFAYQPTSHLTFKIAVFTFSVSTFAFLLPVQAGIGAWHFMVIQALMLFGISEEHGMVFAFIAHTFTNLIFIAFGLVGFILITLLNRKKGIDGLLAGTHPIKPA